MIKRDLQVDQRDYGCGEHLLSYDHKPVVTGLNAGDP